MVKLQKQQRITQRRIDQAYDDKLAGRITEDYFTQRFSGWQEELATIRAEIRNLENATYDSFKKADSLLQLCNRAPELFEKQSPEEQSRLLKLITSNFSWDGVTLRPKYRKPFDMLAEGLHIMSGGAETTFKQNFLRFTQTLDLAHERAAQSLWVELRAA